MAIRVCIVFFFVAGQQQCYFVVLLLLPLIIQDTTTTTTRKEKTSVAIVHCCLLLSSSSSSNMIGQLVRSPSSSSTYTHRSLVSNDVLVTSFLFKFKNSSGYLSMRVCIIRNHWPVISHDCCCSINGIFFFLFILSSIYLVV